MFLPPLVEGLGDQKGHNASHPQPPTPTPPPQKKNTKNEKSNKLIKLVKKEYQSIFYHFLVVF